MVAHFRASSHDVSLRVGRGPENTRLGGCGGGTAFIPKGRIALLVRKRSQSPSRLLSGRACGHRSLPSQAHGNPVLFGTSRMTVIAASVERKERQTQVLCCEA